MTKQLIAIACLLMLIGCTGEDGGAGADGTEGTEGPSGAAGPTGEDGEGTEGSDGAEGAVGDPGLTDDQVADLESLIAPSSEQEACDNIDLEPPAEDDGLQLTISAFFSEFDEGEKCMLVKAPSGGMVVNNNKIRFTAGGHHFVLYKTDLTEIPSERADGTPFTAVEGEVFDCSAHNNGPSTLGTDNYMIAASEDPDIDYNDPLPNAGIEVEGGTYMLLSAHFLNPSAEGIHTCMKVNLLTIDPADHTVTAGTLFNYNPFITVPPLSSSSVSVVKNIPADIHLRTIVSHMHARGGSYVAKLYDENGDFVENVYETSAWDTPSPRVWEADSPLLVKAGSSIEFTCNYESAEDRMIHQGLESTDEMCMLNGGFTFVDEADATEENLNALYSLASSRDEWLAVGGSAGCRDTVECWLTAEPDEQFIFSSDTQACVTDSCYPQEALRYLSCTGAATGDCTDSCSGSTFTQLFQDHCVAGCFGDTNGAAYLACQGNFGAYQTECSGDTAMGAYQAQCVADQEQDVPACITAAVTACATAKFQGCVVDDCVTPCTVGKVTDCVWECMDDGPCLNEATACDAADTCL